MVSNFGFTEHSLTSHNALIPIIYYLYHRDIYKSFSTKKCYEDDRKVIKQWLHIVLIKRVFGASTDTILSQVRQAFTKSENFESIKINDSMKMFPSDKISKKIKKDMSVSDDFIEELLCIQKDNKYAFSILALLYPNLDYKNNNFHKDHLHPISKFTKKYIKNISDKGIRDEFYQPCVYNGIYNLQMLDANENMSKNNMALDDWVNQETDSKNRQQFLDNHLIPDVDLSLKEFKNFIDKREALLLSKLKSILQ